MKKQLMSLLLALLMCYALILPASADYVKKEVSTNITMTVETPVPSYTLSVPESVAFTFEKGQSYEFGEVKIKDAQNFYDNNVGVQVTFSHTPFISGENTVGYDFSTYCAFSGDNSVNYGTPGYRKLDKGQYVGQSTFTFYPCCSSKTGLEEKPTCNQTFRGSTGSVTIFDYVYSFYQTMKMRIELTDPSSRPADGVYTSTVIFNASLSY